ncbi:MAG: hypothetical protein K2G05_07615 [Duncaniella sp.]|nr:hypothetical protein [Bacteroides sp.]MDE6038112.1 hypothetical protein [Duncaniella sp.]MDE6066380.1 hypothetical protein [Duncaniella sp.]
MTSKDIISPNEFLPALPSAPSIERLYPPRDESSRLLVSCIPSDYSASRIARAVEDADAHLLNLNVTTDGERMDNRVVAELRVSHRSPLAVARSLERYGYEVVDVEHEALADDDMANERLNELLHYIDL